MPAATSAFRATRTGRAGTRSHAPGETVVEAVGLVRVFRDFWMRQKARAVDGIDFSIAEHEIFGLLGPNGSGKSTTIKMILGLLNVTAGRLLVFGRLPSDVAVKRRIGYLPEESYMYRFLTPIETLDYYGKLFELDRATRRRRIDELLDMVGLSQVAHRPVGEFSKGMARRLGLAQALVNDPDLLILDEPTSGLDPIGTRQVKDLLLELGRRGKTILLSSHLLADVEDVCDRMIVLYGGKIRAQGSAEELLADTEKTVIQTPRLRPETVARIEHVLEAEGLSIDRVSAPHQRLEDLFMEIVEQARREQVATSGALHGGTTAAFLRGEEERARGEGDELLRSLVEDVDAPKAARLRAAAEKPAAEAGPKAEVLDALVADRPPQPLAAQPPRARDAGAAAPEVDAGLIESLLENDGAEDRRDQPKE
ncbi:MAG TPA: ABC transporter ATP-binding protein [Phycisphaerales bacterium]|nr:ABC transporter ATP-binding protein [Phycisphaerales bacterium]HMP38379.1 ABC transporter ATP-binding protein [Phycisphaerales bacterium]